jgi:hypothetical protein
MKRSVFILAVFLFTGLIVCAAPAFAQAPSPGQYEMEWSNLSTLFIIDLTTGVRIVEVVQGAPIPDYTVTIRDASTLQDLWYVTAAGHVASPQPDAAGAVYTFNPLADGTFGGFYMQVEHGSRGSEDFMSVGRRVVVAPPPPSTSTVKVFITSPASGATLTGRAWFTIWVEGTGPGSITYTLLTDGTERAKTVTTSRGPVSLSAILPIGSYPATVRVVDASGKTASSTVTITVK